MSNLWETMRAPHFSSLFNFGLSRRSNRGSLAGKAKKLLVHGNTSALFAPSGHVLVLDGDTLMARHSMPSVSSSGDRRFWWKEASAIPACELVRVHYLARHVNPREYAFNTHLADLV